MLPVKGIFINVYGHVVAICNSDVGLFRMLVGGNGLRTKQGPLKGLDLHTHVVAISRGYSKTSFSDGSVVMFSSSLMVDSMIVTPQISN